MVTELTMEVVDFIFILFEQEATQVSCSVGQIEPRHIIPRATPTLT